MTEAIRPALRSGAVSRRSDWALLLFWPLYGLAFFALERLVPGRQYHIMFHPMDNLIPFCELFVIPYVLWYFFIAASVIYPLFRDRGAFRRVMYYYMIVFSVSVAVFALYPTAQNLRPAAFPRDNVLSRIMGLLYTLDTNTNVCPSLHVSGAIGAALGLRDTKFFSTPPWKWVLGITAGLICLSTVFLKQHSVWDLFWGLVLSGFARLLVYGKVKKPLAPGGWMC